MRLTVALSFVLWLLGCGDNLDGEPPIDAPDPAPRVVIDQAPPPLSSAAAVEVRFHADGAAAGLRCGLDGATATPCTSPWRFTVGDGAHAIAIAAVTAGGTAGVPATASFTVDTAAPDTAIVTGPADLEASPTATFTFAAVPADAAATFECMTDDDAFTPCLSPATVDRADGVHTFAVRARDAAGNVDATPATRTWRIDQRAPTVAFTGPPAAIIGDLTPTFTFEVGASAATVECRVDGGGYAPCTSPFTIGPALTEAAHEVEVRACSAVAVCLTRAHAFTVDVTPPTITITDGPTGATLDATPSFAFTAGADAVGTRCALDTGEVIDPCTTGVTFPPLALGAHTFTVTAYDGATPANPASATRGFEIVAGICGDGLVSGGEQCDGADLGGATCTSLGHAPGALACAPGCASFVTTGCDGGFVADSAGFSGTLCFDGLRYTPPGQGNAVVACTEDQGLFRSALGTTTELGVPMAWTSVVGTGTATQIIDNLVGRGVAIQPENATVVFLADGAGAHTAFRSNGLFQAVPTAWTQHLYTSGGSPFQVFSAVLGTSANNIVAGWHPILGATVLHGQIQGTMTPSPIGAGVTGTVRAVVKGGTNDIVAVVHGETPSGAAATGAGLYLTCDQIGAAGGTYLAHDTGIAEPDRARLWSLTVDPASFVAGAPRLCGAVMFTGGYAMIYYAALRGGGQVYKTTDGGATWVQRNAGLPAGAEVYSIAIDCASTTAAAGTTRCGDRDLLYAATSVGLYRSTDAGEHWILAGLEGKVVRGVALQLERAVGPAGPAAPHVIAGAVGDGIFRWSP